MALRPDYVVRETASNLVRNPVISVASTLCVAVCLALFGGAIMANEAVERATQRWQEGVEFVVFLNPDASEEQITTVGDNLEASPQIERVTFIDQQAAYQEFTELFVDSPEFIDSVEPEILPPSFRVVPIEKRSDTVKDLGVQFEGQPGVRQVAFATESIQTIQDVSFALTRFALIVAVVLAVVALLIIFTTIQLAILNRRREIEVMKLVGASNAFIRVPFMLEGIVQGVVGAVLAIGGLAIFRPIFQGSLPAPDEFPLLEGLQFANVEMMWIYASMLGLGAVMATISAAIAVTWFLDV
jgi:cell division transport system permease protein